MGYVILISTAVHIFSFPFIKKNDNPPKKKTQTKALSSPQKKKKKKKNNTKQKIEQFHKRITDVSRILSILLNLWFYINQIKIVQRLNNSFLFTLAL